MTAKVVTSFILMGCLLVACTYTTPEQFAQKKISETRYYNAPFESIYICFVERSMLTNTQNYSTKTEAYVGSSDRLKIIFKSTGPNSSSVEFAHMPCCGMGMKKLKKITDQCVGNIK